MSALFLLVSLLRLGYTQTGCNDVIETAQYVDSEDVCIPYLIYGLTLTSWDTDDPTAVEADTIIRRIPLAEGACAPRSVMPNENQNTLMGIESIMFECNSTAEGVMYLYDDTECSQGERRVPIECNSGNDLGDCFCDCAEDIDTVTTTFEMNYGDNCTDNSQSLLFPIAVGVCIEGPYENAEQYMCGTIEDMDDGVLDDVLFGQINVFATLANCRSEGGSIAEDIGIFSSECGVAYSDTNNSALSDYPWATTFTGKINECSFMVSCDGGIPDSAHSINLIIVSVICLIVAIIS